MKIKNIFTVIMLSFLSIACSQTGTTLSKEGANVAVLYAMPTDRTYEELGLITTQTGQTRLHDRTTETMIKTLQEQATELNADAIIIRSLTESTWGLKGDGNTGFERGKAEAIAIQFQ